LVFWQVPISSRRACASLGFLAGSDFFAARLRLGADRFTGRFEDLRAFALPVVTFRFAFLATRPPCRLQADSSIGVIAKADPFVLFIDWWSAVRCLSSRKRIALICAKRIAAERHSFLRSLETAGQINDCPESNGNR
jgi:hypothetical protein